jgi:hypothetical protein
LIEAEGGIYQYARGRPKSNGGSITHPEKPASKREGDVAVPFKVKVSGERFFGYAMKRIGKGWVHTALPSPTTAQELWNQDEVW